MIKSKLQPLPIHPPNAFKAIVGMLLAAVVEPMREVIWADIRVSVLDLRDMPHGARALVITASLVLLSLLGLLFFGDELRASSVLYPLPQTLSGRGATLPSGLMPITLLVLTVGWSLLLLGALRSHWAICLVGLFYGLSGPAIWLVMALAGDLGAGMDSPRTLAQALLGGVGLLAFPLIVLIFRRRAPRPLVEFGVLFANFTLIYAIAQAAHMEHGRATGAPIVSGSFLLTLESMKFLALPLLLVVSMHGAGFARTTSGWLGRILSERLSPALARIALLVLGVACVWRVVSGLMAAMSDDALLTLMRPYLGSGIQVVAIVVACAGMLYLGRSTLASHNTGVIVARSAEHFALPLMLLLNALQLLALVVTQADGVFALGSHRTVLAPWASWLNTIANPYWQHLLYGLALLVGLWLARKTHVGLACYLAALCVTYTWNEWVRPGRPLALLGWHGNSPTDFWLVGLILVIALVWLLRRQLSAPRIGILIGAFFTTTLLRQTDFIENPFSSATSSGFGLGGLGFMAVGILWGAINIGAWANHESKSLPRLSRIFLYFGGLLLALGYINWALITHDMSRLNQLIRDVAVAGFDHFGKPMLYAYIITSLLRPGPVSPTGNG